MKAKESKMDLVDLSKEEVFVLLVGGGAVTIAENVAGAIIIATVILAPIIRTGFALLAEKGKEAPEEEP